MVSRQTLKEHGFRNIHEYFEHILQSQYLVNGKQKQVLTLVEQLTTAQKADALEYFDSYVSPTASECKKLILNAI